MALTYTRLTVLFSDLYLHEQAIYFGKNSLLFYDKHSSSPRRIAWMLNEIGAQYEMIEVLDSANQYYFEGIELLSDTNTITYRDLKTHIVFLSYEKGENPSFSLMQTCILLNQAATRKEYLSRCLTIGEIFYHENEYDSAYVYLKKVFSETPKTSPKKQAAEWLVETCKRLEKDEEILEYASFLTTFANQDENQSATKSHLTELCNVYRQNVLERRHQQIIQKNTVRNIVIIIGLLNVMLVIILLYHRNKKKLEHYENDTLYENEPSSKSWDKLAEFLGEPICQEIVRSIQNENIKRMATPKDYPHHILSNAQLQQLTLTVNRYFGSFENYLGQRANPSLVNLCHLYLLGIDEKRASILLNKDYSSIKRYEKKLKTIFQTQENMTSYLRNLMINN